MTAYLVAAIIVAIAIGVAVIMAWGFQKILERAIRRRLQPDETILFQTGVSRCGVFNVLLGTKEGLIAITQRRLLLGFWRALPPRNSVDEIALRDIEEANILRAIGVSQVQIVIGDRNLILVPKQGRYVAFWPQSRKPAEELVNALQQATGGRISTSTTKGFTESIRKQIGQNR
jgi:hypothetical protein